MFVVIKIYIVNYFITSNLSKLKDLSVLYL